MEEKVAGINFWLVGDNFLMGYYSVYDMATKQVALASSQYILNGSYTYNNSIVVIPPQ